jgi:gallate decarboxylase subunit D
MKPFSWTVKKDRFLLRAWGHLIGQDLLIAVWGGTHPHIGAVGLALPRPSLRNPRKTSATSSVLTLLGHKEDVTVKLVSEALASALKKNVVVAAGIHWDNLKTEEIEVLVKMTEQLTEKMIEKIKKAAR